MTEINPTDLTKIEIPTDTPDYYADAGSPLPPDTPLADKESIIAALKAVNDPELLLNIYELGLVYDINQDAAGNVQIVMTLTSPMLTH